nr:translation initiation factor IF-2-like [Aegilops tauschii subsp. strangulata]
MDVDKTSTASSPDLASSPSSPPAASKPRRPLSPSTPVRPPWPLLLSLPSHTTAAITPWAASKLVARVVPLPTRSGLALLAAAPPGHRDPVPPGVSPRALAPVLWPATACYCSCGCAAPASRVHHRATAPASPACFPRRAGLAHAGLATCQGAVLEPPGLPRLADLRRTSIASSPDLASSPSSPPAASKPRRPLSPSTPVRPPRPLLLSLPSHTTAAITPRAASKLVAHVVPLPTRSGLALLAAAPPGHRDPVPPGVSPRALAPVLWPATACCCSCGCAAPASRVHHRATAPASPACFPRRAGLAHAGLATCQVRRPPLAPLATRPLGLHPAPTTTAPVRAAPAAPEPTLAPVAL